ncbi:diaminopimelate epimerase [Acidobacteria bacterium AH-259-D05]|nr:diaminopimelate epimerase [Acidobacteria bacterium AH-259-D05]
MILAEKYHSCGNDFLVVVPSQVQQEHYSNLSRAICDHHFGVGADGCVFVGEISAAQVHVRIFNRDGSEADMSGNGFRCGCAFLHHRSLVDPSEVTLITRSGVKSYALLEQEEGSWTYQSQMGSPAFEPAAIPFRAPPGVEQVEEYSLDVGDRKICITALSVGNPQCVVFVEEFPQGDDFKRLGSGLEHHPDFPERTNVSFVRVTGSNQLKIKLWERGVGPTHSSGTGACGAAVAALRAGKVQSPVQVSTETGSQRVQWDPGKVMLLTGEAQFIAEIQFHWEQGG